MKIVPSWEVRSAQTSKPLTRHVSWTSLSRTQFIVKHAYKIKFTVRKFLDIGRRVYNVHIFAIKYSKNRIFTFRIDLYFVDAHKW